MQDPISNQVEKSLSLIELVRDGGIGAQIIIIILSVLFVVSLYIYIERSFVLKSAQKIDETFMEQIKHYVKQGKINDAKQLCVGENSPISNLLSKGISRIGKPLEDISSSIENAGKLEVYKLEKNVSILATIAGVGPMLGFLGTVIGMIISIFEISNAGGNIDMKLLSNGLYTAMTTTVAGLIVGILGYIFYNHLVVKTNNVVYLMESSTIEFLDLLNEPAV
jgi:biopolymer transport protein ExbB